MTRRQRRSRARTVRRVVVVILALTAAGALFVYIRYRQDLNEARERLGGGGRVVQTRCGPIEYSEAGEGKTVLSIHGAGGGWDQGLLIRTFIGEGFRVIAPSRFGYLNTPYPNDPSAVAQADTYACLLDHLDIERAAVVAFSAGGPSALQFAIRHPQRTDALVMVSAISDASLVDPRPVDPSQDPVLSALLTDFVFWSATTYFPERALAFFGVSRDAQQRLTREEYERALRVLRMILPMSMRKTGNFNDPAHWFERGEFDLGRIAAPTLVIHSRDDTFVSFAHGQHTAAGIPQARLSPQEFGGHFVYVRDAVLREIRAFLDQHGRTP
jgi:pimeloyl-ACP methyl ester carboxylesterase